MTRIVRDTVKYICDKCKSEDGRFVGGRETIGQVTLNHMLYGEPGLQANVQVQVSHRWITDEQHLCKACTITVLENVLATLKSK